MLLRTKVPKGEKSSLSCQEMDQLFQIANTMDSSHKCSITICLPKTKSRVFFFKLNKMVYKNQFIRLCGMSPLRVPVNKQKCYKLYKFISALM